MKSTSGRAETGAVAPLINATGAFAVYGDGNGGAFPSDRARRNPADASSAVARNSGRLPAEATVDVRVSRRLSIRGVEVEPLVEVFNLFNRANFTEINNVFGTGSFPDDPQPTYGQFLRAGPPRQIQLAFRVVF